MTKNQKLKHDICLKCPKYEYKFDFKIKSKTS